jgi:LEA14-like dessication related protein
MKSIIFRRISPFLAIILLSGCATTRSDYEEPKVDVVGIEKSEADSEVAAFTLKLRITNPNAEPIRLNGLFYELSLDGLDVINGTARDLPEIKGYSSQIISVSSTASLINSVRLAAVLMNNQNGAINYMLRAKLGTTSRWLPATTVKKSGTLSLNNL